MRKFPLIKIPFCDKIQVLIIFSCCMLGSCGQRTAASQQALAPGDEPIKEIIITEPPDSLKLDSFYKKYADASGIPVVSSDQVPDSAIFVARDLVTYMLMKRDDIRKELINIHSKVMIIGEHEMETDLPEHRDWEIPLKDDISLTPDERENYDKPGGIASMTGRQYWNERARGMGGDGTSCAEENLLAYKGDRYYGENILIHEFSHTIMAAIETVDAALYSEIKAAYANALDNGLYKGQYAINNANEYWAEGTQWWFWSNIEFYDGDTRIQSPDDLKAYDPVLYDIFDRVYAGHHMPADHYYSLNLRPAR